jgi:hypothetical protein
MPDNRRAQYRAAAIEAADVHELPQVFDLHRVAANDEILEIHDARHRGGRLPFERGFAPTYDALVGLELHEDIRAVRLCDALVERDAEDLHVRDA